MESIIKKGQHLVHLITCRNIFLKFYINKKLKLKLIKFEIVQQNIKEVQNIKKELKKLDNQNEFYVLIKRII